VIPPNAFHPGIPPEKSMSFSRWRGFAQKVGTLFKNARGPILRLLDRVGQLFMK
jgi:hypothetical protein